MFTYLTDAGVQQRRHAHLPTSRANAGRQEYFVGFERARLQTGQPRAGAALLLVVCILPVVVAAAVSTTGWANSSIRLDVIHHIVGLSPRHEPEHHVVGAIPATASQCSSPQSTAFSHEFAALSQAVGDRMGQPLECTHLDPSSGDVLQATSTGLAIYRGRLARGDVHRRLSPLGAREAAPGHLGGRCR